MKTSGKIDMTKGSIIRLILLFALPICIGNVLQQLYNTVDTMIVGNFCDSVSLAAVGTSAQPVEMLLCIFLGIGTGVSILVSQNVGRGDMDAVKRVVTTASAFVYMCGIPLSVLGLFIGPAILKIMQVPEDAFNAASIYVCIIFLGTIGNVGYNMNAGILRGMGDSKSSLFFLLISCVVNIALDLVFVALFKMGVAGAALATIIAMFASWFFSIAYIKSKYPELQFNILPKKPDKKILLEIIGVGLPLGLNNSIYSVGHIVMQSLINAQGSAFMAASSVATKLTGIANVAITALSSASATFSGQNLGAKNYVRLKKGGFIIPLFSGIITCTAGLTITYFCRPILGMFTDEAEVLDLAVIYIRVVLPFTWMYAIFNGIINYVNGLGEVKFTTVVNVMTLWLVRIPVAYVIAAINGTYVMAAIPISFFVGMLSMFTFFLSKRWKEICELAKDERRQLV